MAERSITTIQARRFPYVAIFDAVTGERERTISGQDHKATAVSWATRGKVPAVSDGEHIRVPDADTGNRLWNLPYRLGEQAGSL